MQRITVKLHHEFFFINASLYRQSNENKEIKKKKSIPNEKKHALVLYKGRKKAGPAALTRRSKNRTALGSYRQQGKTITGKEQEK